MASNTWEDAVPISGNSGTVSFLPGDNNYHWIVLTPTIGRRYHFRPSASPGYSLWVGYKGGTSNADPGTMFTWGGSGGLSFNYGIDYVAEVAAPLHMRIYASASDTTINFVWTSDDPPPPGNYTWDTAETISGVSGSIAYDNVGYTEEEWFSLNGDVGRTYRLLSDEPDGYFEVYRGEITDPNDSWWHQLTYVAEGWTSDSPSWPDEPAYVTVQAGRHYWIIVYPNDGATVYHLNWTASEPVTPVANDDFADAQEITGPTGSVAWDNTGSSVQEMPSRPYIPDEDVYRDVRSVWFTFVAEATTIMSFTVTGPSGAPASAETHTDVVWLDWVGDPTYPYTTADSTETGAGPYYGVDATVTKGVQYWVRLYWPKDQVGDWYTGTLSWETVALPANADPTTPEALTDQSNNVRLTPRAGRGSRYYTITVPKDGGLNIVLGDALDPFPGSVYMYVTAPGEPKTASINPRWTGAPTAGRYLRSAKAGDVFLVEVVFNEAVNVATAHLRWSVSSDDDNTIAWSQWWDSSAVKPAGYWWYEDPNPHRYWDNQPMQAEDPTENPPPLASGGSIWRSVGFASSANRSYHLGYPGPYGGDVNPDRYDCDAGLNGSINFGGWPGLGYSGNMMVGAWAYWAGCEMHAGWGATEQRWGARAEYPRTPEDLRIEEQNRQYAPVLGMAPDNGLTSLTAQAIQWADGEGVYHTNLYARPSTSWEKHAGYGHPFIGNSFQPLDSLSMTMTVRDGGSSLNAWASSWTPPFAGPVVWSHDCEPGISGSYTTPLDADGCMPLFMADVELDHTYVWLFQADIGQLPGQEMAECGVLFFANWLNFFDIVGSINFRPVIGTMYPDYRIGTYIENLPPVKRGIPPLRQRARQDGLTTDGKHERGQGDSLQSSERRGARTYH